MWRVATREDLDGLTTLLTAAFEHDPLWRWAFPDIAGLEVWWRFYIESALRRYPTVSIAGDYAAAAVWIPPGGSELTEEDEERIEPLLEELVGPRAREVIELLERFDAAHPHEPPHYYLSLLGTDPRERGKGIGMALLAHNLSAWDAEGVPTYLESSNPRNDQRYMNVGYVRKSSFTTPDDAHTVTTMWREANAGALTRTSSRA